MVPQLATGAPGLVLLDLLLAEEGGCEAYVVSLEIVRHHVLFVFRAVRSATRTGRSITIVGAHFVNPQFVGFVAHLLAVEIIL